MPTAERSVHPRAVDLDSFLELATRELMMYVGYVGVYAELLDAQMAHDPTMSQLREIVREVRIQAELVSALIQDSLGPDRG
jgi:hypothetical protein